MNAVDLRERLGHVENLPSLPETTVALLQILNDADTDVDDINQAMSRDPAMTATVLRIVNSSFYGLRNKVVSVPLAVSILGYRTVRSVVLTASAAGLFGRKNITPEFSPPAFARHSVAVAAVCRFLAKFSRDVAPETAFSAGLLHDIGKLAMDQCFPSEYSQSVRRALALHVPIQQAETDVWGVTHAEVGAQLARHWKLPDDLVDAIEWHHDFMRSPNRTMVACLSMADYVAAVKSLVMTDRSVPAELDRGAWTYLRLDSRVLPDLLALLDKEIEDATLMFAAAGGQLPGLR